MVHILFAILINLIHFKFNLNQNNEDKFQNENYILDFELLKLEIRLSVDMKVLPIKKQAELSLLMDTIGKQITGWSKSQPA